MQNFNVTNRRLILSALIAALYAALTIALEPISYGPLQFRVSEALTLLPFYMGEAVPGLFIGCALANLFGGFGLPDIVFGSLATLLAALATRKSPNLWIGALWPVIFNMAIIGTMLHLLLNVPLMMTCAEVGLGEAGAVFIAGLPLMKLLERSGILAKLKKI
ncbi:MAG: QueT transporter family protein [Synergistaceae bacterium]|nr:QueT transporter family protein [Synergistaceae bacterium]